MKKGKSKFLQYFKIILCLASGAAVILPLFLTDITWPAAARDYLESRAVAESGAINLVSAIYLGYRALDTLGETIVLLVAVSGTIGIIAQARGSLAKGYGLQELSPEAFSPGTRPPVREHIIRRTELIDVVTGKLGPVVLMFGLYVMLFGHLSPGGGFQGGVVVASGIVFIALGSKGNSNIRLTWPGMLARLEAISFLLLVLAAVSGSAVGSGFFANPLEKTSLPPEGFIILLNAIIGLKVGAGIGFMCVAMMGREES